MLASGQAIELKTNNYQATIVTVGAGLAALTFKGKAICLSHDVDAVASAHMGKWLIPWPNRLYQGQYSWNNASYQVPVGDMATPSAIHGLCAWENWLINSQSATSVELVHVISARPWYPFTLQAKVNYELSDEHGLKITATVTNLAKTKAPVGIGVHPYITCNNKPINECTLTLSQNLTQQHFDSEYKLQNPEGTCCGHCAPSKDLSGFVKSPQKINDLQLDHCFATTEDGPWEVTLADDQLSCTLAGDSPFIQLFTAEKLNRTGFAVEPMSCTVNAFNQKDADFTVSLDPQESRQLSFSIFASEK